MKKDGEAGEEGETIKCPLCQEGFKSKDTLEEHAMQLHSIIAEGLQRLMMLMQGSHWLNSMKKTDRDEEEGREEGGEKEEERGEKEEEMGRRGSLPISELPENNLIQKNRKKYSELFQ